jgi:phosphoribosylformylglycinamidine synthase
MARNYIADPHTIDRLEQEGRVLFRYAAPTARSIRTGTSMGTNAIAGILSDDRNILG